MMLWVGALGIGIALGLLGSGGSILTVPTLVYLVGQPERVAVAGSLAIVGIISALGALSYIWRKQVSWRNVAFFGVPGMFGTYAGAWLSAFVASKLQLILFAVVMLLAAALMLRPMRLARPVQARSQSGGAPPRVTWKIALDGTSVGILTGLVGVGGGFLIIPALVLLGGLSMQTAVGTSLIIIALKSFSGFFKYLDVLKQHHLALDWHIVAVFASAGTIGSVIGSIISNLIPQEVLRKVFGSILILMGAFILWNNLGHAPIQH